MSIPIQDTKEDLKGFSDNTFKGEKFYFSRIGSFNFGAFFGTPQISENDVAECSRNRFGVCDIDKL